MCHMYMIEQVKDKASTMSHLTVTIDDHILLTDEYADVYDIIVAHLCDYISGPC